MLKKSFVLFLTLSAIVSFMALDCKNSRSEQEYCIYIPVLEEQFKNNLYQLSEVIKETEGEYTRQDRKDEIFGYRGKDLKKSYDIYQTWLSDGTNNGSKTINCIDDGENFLISFDDLKNKKQHYEQFIMLFEQKNLQGLFELVENNQQIFLRPQH